MSKPPQREVSNRLQDLKRGIFGGSVSVDMNARGRKEKDPLPELHDFGIPLPTRRKLEEAVEEHFHYGEAQRVAEKAREKLTVTIKELCAEHVPDDIPSFICGLRRLTRYTQQRERIDKDVLRRFLLGKGVKPGIVADALTAATVQTPVLVLKISDLQEDDGE